uniref:Uncharacterized protein n=1 Tax=Tanacetum cinerariifolium TaxID=118510 RepID=A0A6L2MFZ4_TANCI|nr:hypothetical protein [Tanacetum cinerariifolium]
MDAERIKAQRKRTRKEKVEKDQTVKKQKGDELEQYNTKKQNLEEQQEAKELKKNLEIVPDDEDDVFVNVKPLSSKPSTIVNYKIYKEGKKEHYQIIRANGHGFFVISISSNSSKESVGTSTARVILFGMIPTTISPTTPNVDLLVIHDDTPLIPTDTPIISPIVPTIPLIASTSRVASRVSPLPSPIHQILPAPLGLPRQPPILVLLAHLILVGRPYRTPPNGVLKMLTAQKSVRSLPTYQLALRYSADYSSLDQFTSDDSSQDSPSDSSLETSSNSHSDTSSYSSLIHSLSVSPIRRAPSPVCADLLSPRKRIRASDSVTDFEADIDECFAYADAIRARGTDVRVVVETAAEEEVEFSARVTTKVEVEVDLRVRPVIHNDVRESVKEDVPDHVTADRAVEVTYETLGGLIQICHDHTMEIPTHRIQVIESV